MSCIISSFVSILINGTLISLFRPSWRIRQGDPLSPYIIIIFMKSSLRLIHFAIQESIWQPVRIGRIGVPIFHLLFGNDIIFLAKAGSINASSIIHNFNALSNQWGKKSISTNPPSFFHQMLHHARNELSTMMNIRQSENIGKYLGLTIANHHPKIQDFQYTIDNLNKKLSG